MVNYAPKRGDIVWIDFDPQKGSEIQKTRPAVVITEYRYNLKSGLALFVPITSKIKNYPFEVKIDHKDIEGVALCDQIRSLDWNIRKVNKIATINQISLQNIISKIQLLIS
jgi:mRNA interferase MazF